MKYDSTKKRVKLKGNWIGQCVNGTITLKREKELECSTSNTDTNTAITNGSFEQRYHGFTSHFPIESVSNSGSIKIVQDAKDFDNHWIGKGDGCFLAVDGGVSNEKGVWIQKVPLDPRTYKVELSFEISNLNQNQNGCRVQAIVDGKVLGAAQCPLENNKWETHSFTFKTNKPSLNLSLINQRFTEQDDNFGIDNITLTQFSKDSIEVSLFYEQNIYSLTDKHKVILDSLIKTLRNHPESSINITGYASDIGESSANQTLSQNRANQIVKFLTDNGISEKKTRKEAKGEIELKTKELIENQRIKNRRVDLKISNIIKQIE